MVYKKENIFNIFLNNDEFDPGSEWMLKACIIHASLKELFLLKGSWRTGEYFYEKLALKFGVNKTFNLLKLIISYKFYFNYGI
jgi:hypothetical protein